MRALVTGASGFIGTPMAKRLTDDDRVLSDSRLMRFGLAAPFLFAARRIAFDFGTIIGNRRDLEIAWYETPFFVAASLLARTLEVAGGLISVARPDYLPRRFGW